MSSNTYIVQNPILSGDIVLQMEKEKWLLVERDGLNCAVHWSIIQQGERGDYRLAGVVGELHVLLISPIKETTEIKMEFALKLNCQSNQTKISEMCMTKCKIKF